MVELQPPKLYLNGFPKSGLHLAEQMVYRMFDPVDREQNWYGTNPWTIERYELDSAVDSLSAIKPGHYLKGHSGYMPALDELFNVLQVAMLFIYRDLRDVVVSQTYHILSDDDTFFHPGRWVYEQIGAESKDAVMWEGIVGNENLPGVVDRWVEYAPWMDCTYVHSICFEDMVKKPEKVASEFFEWVYGLSGTQDDLYIDREVRRNVVELMVSEMKKKDMKRTTFRKGEVGQWKREFTAEHVRAFKESDPDNVLYKLGYTRKVDW